MLHDVWFWLTWANFVIAVAALFIIRSLLKITKRLLKALEDYRRSIT